VNQAECQGLKVEWESAHSKFCGFFLSECRTIAVQFIKSNHAVYRLWGFINIFDKMTRFGK
jgi:hypothetical protein